MNSIRWLCFVAWEPRDTVLEMLKGEKPGNLVVCVPYLYAKRWEDTNVFILEKKINLLLNAM